MTHFERLEAEAEQQGYEVGVINGLPSIILRRDPTTGLADWHIYDHGDGGVTLFGPDESDDQTISLDGMRLADILRLIEQLERKNGSRP